MIRQRFNNPVQPSYTIQHLLTDKFYLFNTTMTIYFLAEKLNELEL